MSRPQLKLLEAAWCHYRAQLLEAEANLQKLFIRYDTDP